ncbi:MAG: ABC transporter permease [Natronosporangium sp.]
MEPRDRVPDLAVATGPPPRAPVRPPRSIAPYLLAGPAVLVLVAVFLVAMATLGEFSLHRFVDGVTSPGRTLAQWREFLGDSYQWSIVLATVRLGLVTTAGCAVVGYATALALHRLRSPALRTLCGFVLFAPLLTSVVARSYGWALLLDDTGLVNTVLAEAGLTGSPVRLLYHERGVVIAMVHILLPFMVFPLLASLRQVGDDMLEAAADLGSPWWHRFRRVSLPLSVPGLVAGCQLCFALAISAFATPSLLGGGRVQVLATNVYADVGTLNWPRAAIGCYVLLALALLAFAGFGLWQRRAYALRGAR